MLKNKVFIILIVMSLLVNLLIVGLGLYHWQAVRPVIAKTVKENLILSKIGITLGVISPPQTVNAEPQPPEEQAENLGKLMTLINQQLQQLSSESERLDFLRQFIYNNSIHQGGSNYAWDTPTVLSMMYETLEHQHEPPELTCGSRTFALKMLLDTLERENRIVMIFSDAFEIVRSHTFLEVWNAETRRWEIQDPDKNLYYIDRETSLRVSTAQLVFGNLETLMPCSPDKSCGWDVNNLTRYLDNRRFGAVMYDHRRHFDTQPANKKSVVLVNTDRFSIEKPFPGNEGKHFLQFANEQYGKPIFILNQSFK